MRKYAILMSYNYYLYSGLKTFLHDINILLFHENEIDNFLNLTAGVNGDEMVIFYDEQFSKITSLIFHDMESSLINVKQLKNTHLNDLLALSEAPQSGISPSTYKSKIMERRAIYYYAFHKMGYSEIAKKMKIPQARVSYFINNFVKGRNFRHKNDFVINLESL